MAFIRAITGELGGGKTTVCVAEMLARHLVEPDRLFASNIEVTPRFVRAMGGRFVFLEYEMVQSFWEHVPKGSSIYLDEGVVHFDARCSVKGAKENPELTNYLTHVRKQRDDLTVIIQKIGFLEKRFRELATLYTWCMSSKQALDSLKIPFVGWLPEWFYVREFADEEFKECLGGRIVRSGPGLWAMFESYADGTAKGVIRLGEANAALRASKLLEEAGEDVGGVTRAGFGFGRAAMAATVAAAVGVGAGFV